MANTSELSANTRNLTVDAEQSATHAPTAATKVFSITELLENILFHLPVLDLVKATGVSKIFRNVVQASLELQRKLFLSPSKYEAEYWCITTPRSDDYKGESLLYRMMPSGIVDATLKAHLDAAAKDPYSWYQPTHDLKVVSICPMVELSNAWFKYPIGLGYWSWNETLELRLRIKPRASRALEPWKSMFITSPPCQKARMDLIWEGRVAGSVKIMIVSRNEVRCEEGITLASLVDEVARRVSTIEVWTRNDDSEKEQTWNKRLVKDTSLHDQVAICSMSNSELAWQISTDSSIKISSMVSPAESVYKEMDLHGHVVVSRNW